MSKRKPEEPKAGAPDWLGTYGDMVTLLLTFFVLLFAMSSIDSAKFTALAAALASNSSVTIFEGGGADGISDMLGNGIMEMPIVKSSDTEYSEEINRDKAEFEKMASDFKTYFAENSMAEQIEVVAVEDTLVITFKDEILFDSGSAVIKEKALEALDFIANEILKYPNIDIEIYGHTDNMPIATAIYPDNWFLSAARAINVGHFLIDVKGFAPQHIVPIPRGEYEPIAPNDTPVNRSKNRRVELTIRKSGS